MADISMRIKPVEFYVYSSQHRLDIFKYQKKSIKSTLFFLRRKVESDFLIINTKEKQFMK